MSYLGNSYQGQIKDHKPHGLGIRYLQKSIKPVFDGHRLDEDTLILLARIDVETQEGGSLSDNLLELI